MENNKNYNKLLHLNEIFSSFINYKFINSINKKQIRNIKKGVNLHDAFLYRFSYCQKNKTKESIISDINYKNGSNLYRNSFESKEDNISILIYKSALKLVKDYYDKLFGTKDKKIILVDGTNNINNKYQNMLNMGYFDLNGNVPIDLTYDGTKNRNKEITCLIKQINNKPNDFENCIIVGDRFYFSNKLMHILDLKNIKFIIRGKTNAKKIKSEKKYRILERENITNQIFSLSKKESNKEKKVMCWM